MKLSLTVHALLFALLTTATAHAQQLSAQDVAMRLDLLRQAQEQHNAGHHAEALSLAQRAASISMTPSLRVFVAQEQRTLGQVSDAYANAQTCIRDAEHDSSLRDRDRILAACRQIAASLETAIGRVVVHVPDRPAGLRVTVGNAELNAAFFDVGYIVTPGTITVEASAPDHTTFHQQIVVAAGASPEVTVRLASAPAAAAPQRVPAGGSATAVRHGSINAAAIGVTVAGVVILAGGAIAAIFQQQGISSLGHDCATAQDGTFECNASSSSLYNNTVALTVASDVAFGVGAAVTLAGAAWLVVGAVTGHHEERAPVALVPVQGGGMISTAWSF